MDLQERIAGEFEKRKEGLLIFALLLGFGFFINRGVELKGLYMDDLYLWSCYGEQSFREYVFPVGGTRFRFIFYLASWLELFFLGNHVSWMVPFNIILNSLIAYSLYRICVRMSGGRKIVSLALAAAYLLSRMSYYQIGQFYGLMESLGLWAAMGILYCLYRYANEKKTLAYLAANLLYFLASFIHERYMVLFPVLLLGLLFGAADGSGAAWAQDAGEEDDDISGRRAGKSRSAAGAGCSDTGAGRGSAGADRRSVGSSRSRASRSRSRRMEAGMRGSSAAQAASRQGSTPKWLLLLLSAAVMGAIQLIRYVTIGTLSPAGTGGTDVADTFALSDAIGHAWEQVAFVFGRNSGPDYLCIQPFADSPENIRTMILGTNAVLAAAVLVFFVCWFRDRGRILIHLKNMVLFLAFIALCIGSSSVTIRVEMRWVYVAYAAALLVFSYMSSIMGKAGILVLVYVAFLFPSETYYRDNWDKLYLWPDQLKYNSLAEETFEKYGDDIFNKQVYIIRNTYEMSEFTAETFLKVYDKDGKGKNTTIRFIDSDFDLKEITDDMVILGEDPSHNAYQDVTEFVKIQRLNQAYGSYPDGWVDQYAKIVFMNGNNDGLRLHCYYPGEITGSQICQIRINGERMPDLVFTDNNMDYEIQAAPYQMISLELSCNFYVEDALEKRSDENLAMIISIGAKK